jgi:hypothetical protein
MKTERVEKRPLVESASARGVHEHRRQEDNGRVQVEHGRHDRNQSEQCDQKYVWSQRRSREPRPDRFEQPVRGGDRADQQQSRDEHERRPRLPCRG